MKKTVNAKNLAFCALCIALCVVLPMAFHAIANAGMIFLPMHIPVLLCGRRFAFNPQLPGSQPQGFNLCAQQFSGGDGLCLLLVDAFPFYSSCFRTGLSPGRGKLPVPLRVKLVEGN